MQHTQEVMHSKSAPYQKASDLTTVCLLQPIKYHHISSTDYISHMHLALEIQHEDFLIFEVTKQ